MQYLISRKRMTVALEDLAYFAALPGISLKSLQRFRGTHGGHYARIVETCHFDNRVIY